METPPDTTTRLRAVSELPALAERAADLLRTPETRLPLNPAWERFHLEEVRGFFGELRQRLHGRSRSDGMEPPSSGRGVRRLGQQGEQDSCERGDAYPNQATQSIGNEFPLQAIGKIGAAPRCATPGLIARCCADTVRPLCSGSK